MKMYLTDALISLLIHPITKVPIPIAIAFHPESVVLIIFPLTVVLVSITVGNLAKALSDHLVLLVCRDEARVNLIIINVFLFTILQILLRNLTFLVTEHG